MVLLVNEAATFDILDDLRHAEGKTIIMVEQNAKKGLEFADVGYVFVRTGIRTGGDGRPRLDVAGRSGSGAPVPRRVAAAALAA